MSASTSSTTKVAARGAKNMASDMMKSNVATDGWVQHETGSGDDKGRTAFDQAPHDEGADDAYINERMRDMVSLQPHFGGDKLMGEKPYDESMKRYLENIREQRVR